jgi:hypothetical protein
MDKCTCLLIMDYHKESKCSSQTNAGNIRYLGFDSTVSGQGPVAGCCERGDESSGSCATELVSYK